MIRSDQMLISGVEPHEVNEGQQMWRVFIGPRWRGRYIVVGNKEGHAVYDAFHTAVQLYAGIPDDAERFEETGDERTRNRELTREEEKQRYYDTAALIKATEPVS